MGITDDQQRKVLRGGMHCCMGFCLQVSSRRVGLFVSLLITIHLTSDHRNTPLTMQLDHLERYWKISKDTSPLIWQPKVLAQIWWEWRQRGVLSSIISKSCYVVSNLAFFYFYFILFLFYFSPSLSMCFSPHPHSLTFTT